MPYFDAATAAPLHPAARAALLACVEDGWADPGRLHREGRRARMLLDAARETVAEALGARPDELRFTPSGTLALHLGIRGALAGRRRTGRRLVVSAVEHSAVLHAAEAHEADGGEAVRVPVDRLGRIGPDAWRAAVGAEGTALACVQTANHEVGTVQPVGEVAAACAAAGVPLLLDAAQTAGRGPVPGGWSLLAASARKWGGPAGVGVLAVRRRARFAGPLPGWARGDVPGALDLPAVVAAAAALRAVAGEAEEEDARLAGLVDRIRRRVPELVPDAEVLGDPVDRLPHVVAFSCLYVDGEVLLSALDRAGFAVSSGSSCTSDTLAPSHVLAAMGVFTGGNVRVSLPRGTAEEDVERFLAVLPGLVAEARAGRPGAGSAVVLPGEPAAGKHAAGEPAAGDCGPAVEGAGGGAAPGPDAPALTLDTRGLRCPVPVTELARHIGDVEIGSVVAVLADDEVAAVDVPAWCHTTGHGYEGALPEAGGAAAHLVRRLR